MSSVGVLGALVVAGVATTGVLADPSELVLDSVPGFELTSGPAVDLTYAEFAEQEPDSVAHLTPDSDEANGMLGVIEVWIDSIAEESMVIELVRAIDDESATTFVDQAAANAIAVGLAATDPPFGGAWSYSGGIEDSWTNVVSWNQGPYAVILTQLSLVEIDRSAIDAAAVRQAEVILDATGAAVSDAAAVAGDAPPAPTEPTTAPATGDDENEADDLPVGVIVVALAALVSLGLLIARRRRHDRTPTVVGS
jgi:MYXO-CTERM domain-containing protein